MKSFLTIATILLISSLAHGESELSLAFKGGPNTATLAKTYRTNRYGFSGGFSGQLQRRLIDGFSLGGQIDLLYTPRGAEVVFEGEYLGKSREHYVDLGVAVRPEVRLGPTSMYLLLGGSLNLLVSAIKENASGVNEDITGDLHRIDVALLGGVGVALRLPRRELGSFRLGTAFLEARHDIGLIDTDAANGGFKNRTSSLMLGLSFVVGGPPSPTTTATPAE
jgi:hypothetical protein